VAHGAGSGKGIYLQRFSNQIGSGATSLGVQITKEVYYGRHGKVLRVAGLERWNNNAYVRYIEVHSAKYIGNGKTGKSLGCYAVPVKDYQKIFKLLGTGTIIVSYYPDSNWLQTSLFLKG
jgi:hypothetical protein